jgi:DNA-binding transcriptional LysR family regulator
MATQAQAADLEVSLLRMFLAVVEHGSIGKAAAAVDMTQPGVSQQMLRLEKIVGQKLFARARNGVRLTRHGELLVNYANRAVELSQETLLCLREQEVNEQVVVGASPDSALAGLIPGLRRLQSSRPKLELKVVVNAAEKLDGLLKAGEFDLVITSPNVMTAMPGTTWRVPLRWAACKNLQIDRSRPLPLVLFESPCHWQDEMLDCLRTAGWEWRRTFESSSLDAILTAAQSGLGITALPMETIRNFKLACVTEVGLPQAPTVEFGIFSGTALTDNAQTVLDVVNAAIFDPGQTAPISPVMMA